jgi:23S rRNA (guanosine2251-2'-O)-methyltransferase
MKKRLVLVVHNVRSAYNVGSILRTADGFGVDKVYLSGFTPYPLAKEDSRLPHVAIRADKQIAKTALGAEGSVPWQHVQYISKLLTALKKQDYLIVALEQTAGAATLNDFRTKKDAVLIVGSEVGGVSQKILRQTDACLVIPMLGAKDSFNVAAVMAVALYHLRYIA